MFGRQACLREAGDRGSSDEIVEAKAFEDGSKEKTIPGQGTYTIAPDGTVTFSPEAVPWSRAV